MTTEDRLTNLMFLMTLAPLAAGCPGDDAGTNNTSFNPTPSGMTTTGSATTTTGGPGNMNTTGAESGEATVGTPPNEDTTDAIPPDDTTAGDTEGVMCPEPTPVKGEIEPSCVAYGELLSECYYAGQWPQECIDGYANYCQEQLNESDMACAMALIDFNVCLSQLTCEQLTGKDPQCEAEEMAFDMACVQK